MKRLVKVFIICSLVLISCNDDDDMMEEPIIEQSINSLSEIVGEWKYVKITSTEKIDLNSDGVKNNDLLKELEKCILDNSIFIENTKYQVVENGVICEGKIENEVIQQGTAKFNIDGQSLNFNYDFGDGLFNQKGFIWLNLSRSVNDNKNILEYSLINEEGFPGSKLIKIEMIKVAEN